MCGQRKVEILGNCTGIQRGNSLSLTAT